MKNAFLFAGQGCQKEGMVLDLYQYSDKAYEIIGEKYSDIIFHGTGICVNGYS